MCELCVTHGYGKTWYKSAENYARHMYKLRKPGQSRQGFETDPEQQVIAIVEETIEAKTVAPERFDEMVKTARRLVSKLASCQAIPIQEAEKVIDMASPIALIP